MAPQSLGGTISNNDIVLCCILNFAKFFVPPWRLSQGEGMVNGNLCNEVRFGKWGCTCARRRIELVNIYGREYGTTVTPLLHAD